MDQIRVLAIDDNPAHTEQIKDLLDGKVISECTLSVDIENNFSNGLSTLQGKEYDIVILDVYEGDPSEENRNLHGQEVLGQIKQAVPIAVILYTALPAHVEDLASPIVRVVSKNGGDIEEEIKSLIDGGLPLIKQKFIAHLHKELTEYYWEFAEKHPELIATVNDDHLFEYLIARRLALTLNKENTNQIFGDGIGDNKVHPLSMYIFPPLVTDRFEMGDILKKDDDSYWIVLTPSCDFAHNKAEHILLASAAGLSEHKDFIKYQSNKTKYADNLKRLIKSTRNERYYFLPKIQMIGMPDLVIDLQVLTSFPTDGFSGYSKIAKLDDPYAQDLQAMFTRSQNRPGSPDIDEDHVIEYLNEGDQETIDDATEAAK